MPSGAGPGCRLCRRRRRGARRQTGALGSPHEPGDQRPHRRPSHGGRSGHRWRCPLSPATTARPTRKPTRKRPQRILTCPPAWLGPARKGAVTVVDRTGHPGRTSGPCGPRRSGRRDGRGYGTRRSSVRCCARRAGATRGLHLCSGRSWGGGGEADLGLPVTAGCRGSPGRLRRRRCPGRHAQGRRYRAEGYACAGTRACGRMSPERRASHRRRWPVKARLVAPGRWLPRAADRLQRLVRSARRVIIAYRGPAGRLFDSCCTAPAPCVYGPHNDLLISWAQGCIGGAARPAAWRRGLVGPGRTGP
jgi:hypothetical protein